LRWASLSRDDSRQVKRRADVRTDAHRATPSVPASRILHNVSS
jgi:hypothetical protein